MKLRSTAGLGALVWALSACGGSPSSKPGSPSPTVHLGVRTDWTSGAASRSAAAQAWREQPHERTARALVRAYYPDLVSPELAAEQASPPSNHALTVTLPEGAGAPLVLSTRGDTFRVTRLDQASFSTDHHLWAMAGHHRSDRVEEYEVVEAGTSYQARYRVELPAGRVALRDGGDTLEFTVAPATRPTLRMHFPQVRDVAGRGRGGVVSLEGVAPMQGRPGHFLAQGSFELTLAVDLEGLQGPLVVDPGWSATSSMAGPRAVHTTTMLASGQLLVAGGENGSDYLSSAELYDPATDTWTAAGSMAEARESHTATRLPNGQVLIAGGCNGASTASCSHSLDRAELFDPATGTWSSAGTLTSTRDSHTATLLPDGRVLLVGGATGSTAHASTELYDPATGGWSATGALATGRYWHVALLLSSGQVLVAGGYDGTLDREWASAELYDPATGRWSAASPMQSPRRNLSATVLPSGKVLVAGGFNAAGALNSAELYDPASGTWSATGSLGGGRYSQTATLLPQGKVLVTGGMGTLGFRKSTELYDPATGKWTSGGNLSSARHLHTATLLPWGQVLVVGGYPEVTFTDPPLATAESFDPGAGGSMPTGDLVTARSEHQAVLLPSGQVLIAGGWNGAERMALAERFDPRSGTWSATGSMAQARVLHTLTLLPSGKVLVSGGLAEAELVSLSELYDPNTGAWSPAGSLSTARYGHTATLLPSGGVLVTGGCADVDCTAALATAELFDPSTGAWTSAGSMLQARANHTATLLPSGKLLLAGGEVGEVSDASAELYDPATGTFSASEATMATPRSQHSATLLPSGKVLALGGGAWPITPTRPSSTTP